MNIRELKSAEIKKKLGAESVRFRWHNKNKSGGNFGLSIIGVKGRDYEISGYYNITGKLYDLRFGFIYQAGISMSVSSVEEMFEFIKESLERIG